MHLSSSKFLGNFQDHASVLKVLLVYMHIIHNDDLSYHTREPQAVAH